MYLFIRDLGMWWWAGVKMGKDEGSMPEVLNLPNTATL